MEHDYCPLVDEYQASHSVVDTLCTGNMRKLLVRLYVLCIFCGLDQSKESFMTKFQESGSLSNSERAAFSGAIPHLKDLRFVTGTSWSFST